MKRKVAFKTLGCRLNQFETDSVLTDFYKSGYDIVGFNEPADVYVVNTCTVTNQGDHKSKTAISPFLFHDSCGRVLPAEAPLVAGIVDAMEQAGIMAFGPTAAAAALEGSKTFTKLIREIMVSARAGGGDINANPRLRTAFLAARAENMPKDNIDRAIKKATGGADGVS